MPQVVNQVPGAQPTAQPAGTAQTGIDAMDPQTIITNSIHPEPIQNPTTQGTSQAPGENYLQFASTFAHASALSLEGSQYVKDLTTDLHIYDTSIQVLPLAQPTGSYAIIRGNMAILLLFAEALSAAEYPVVAYSQMAMDATKAVVNKPAFLMTIVVDRKDYFKYAIMSAHIRNVFHAVNSGDMITLKTFQNTNLEVSYDPAIYDDYVRRTDPHAVPVRADIKMTIQLKTHQHQNRNVTNMYQEVAISRHIILAIGAYVDFKSILMPNPQGPAYQPMERFMPVIHVNFISPDMTPGMMSLAAVLAVQQLIDQREWMRSLRNIGENDINMGNLVLAPDQKQPFNASSIEDIDTILRTFCTQPYIVFDIIDGRATSPELINLLVDKANGYMIQSINNFLAGSGNPLGANEQIATLVYTQYTGTIGMNGSMVDSANCDYLHCIKMRRGDMENCRRLLQTYQNPKEDIKVVKSFFDDFHLLYLKHCCGINKNIIRSIQKSITSVLPLPISNITMPGYIDFNQYIPEAAGYQQSVTFAGNAGYGSVFTPVGSVYGFNRGY